MTPSQQGVLAPDQNTANVVNARRGFLIFHAGLFWDAEEWGRLSVAMNSGTLGDEGNGTYAKS